MRNWTSKKINPNYKTLKRNCRILCKAMSGNTAAKLRLRSIIRDAVPDFWVDAVEEYVLHGTPFDQQEISRDPWATEDGFIIWIRQFFDRFYISTGMFFKEEK